jgi:hypothetical protein
MAFVQGIGTFNIHNGVSPPDSILEFVPHTIPSTLTTCIER